MAADGTVGGRGERFTLIAVHVRCDTAPLNARITELIDRAGGSIGRVLIEQLRGREPDLHPTQARMTGYPDEYCGPDSKIILAGLYLACCVRRTCERIAECLGDRGEIHIILETVLDAEGTEEFDPRERPVRTPGVIDLYRSMVTEGGRHAAVCVDGNSSHEGGAAASATIYFHEDIEAFLRHVELANAV